MKVEVIVPEVVEMFMEIQTQLEKLFEMIRDDIREPVGSYLSSLMGVKLTHFLGRGTYERSSDGQVNHRNGSYARSFTLKGIGEVPVSVPRDRKGTFTTQIITRSKQYEDALREDLTVIFLTGISTRSLSMISKRLLGRTLSPAELSKANKELIAAVENWRTRDLSTEPITYLFVDGATFDMRVGGHIEPVPVLIAIGVTDTGRKLVLGFQAGDNESASNRREFFEDLRARGLNCQSVTLGIMDGLTGLETVFKEEFPHARVQRCQLHVARNVLAKVTTKRLKKVVADAMRSIFYASSRQKAREGILCPVQGQMAEGISLCGKMPGELHRCLPYLFYLP